LATGFGLATWKPLSAADINRVEAIVVLGAGIWDSGGGYVTVPSDQTVLNAREAARLFHLHAGDTTVLASGGIADPRLSHEPETVILLDLLRKYGVPSDRILLESGSRTTHEQAERVTPMLMANHWDRFALVTAPVHLLRAVRVFKAQGVSPIAAPAPFRFDGPEGPPVWWRPSIAALGRSEESFYDYFAFLYYWSEGWLKPASPPN